MGDEGSIGKNRAFGIILRLVRRRRVEVSVRTKENRDRQQTTTSSSIMYLSQRGEDGGVLRVREGTSTYQARSQSFKARGKLKRLISSRLWGDWCVLKEGHM